MSLNRKEKHDLKRKDAPRLPSSRIIDTDKAKIVEMLYLMHKEALSGDSNKLEALVDSCDFAINNKALFEEFLKNKKGV